MDKLFRRVGDTVHATIYGTLVVAAVQGTLGGLMFWWLGLPTPLLWGVVMGLLAVVPVLGAFVVGLTFPNSIRAGFRPANRRSQPIQRRHFLIISTSTALGSLLTLTLVPPAG